MSEQKYTAGPWVTCDAHGAIENGGCVQEMASGRERMIAACCHYVSREEVIANAKLIAAAPELLAALQEMTALVKMHSYPQPDKPSSNYARAEHAESVIAKALGK